MKRMTTSAVLLLATTIGLGAANAGQTPGTRYIPGSLTESDLAFGCSAEGLPLVEQWVYERYTSARMHMTIMGRSGISGVAAWQAEQLGQHLQVVQGIRATNGRYETLKRVSEEARSDQTLAGMYRDGCGTALATVSADGIRRGQRTSMLWEGRRCSANSTSPSRPGSGQLDD